MESDKSISFSTLTIQAARKEALSSLSDGALKLISDFYIATDEE